MDWVHMKMPSTHLCLRLRSGKSCTVQQRLPANASEVKGEPPSSMSHPYYPPLLLAFLTQTARFHDKLVEQIDPKQPIATANFYAQATRTQMGPDFPGKPNLEKIQALLMLGYHEWTVGEGIKGWVRIGHAIRCAQALGYQWDAAHDDFKAVVAKEGDKPMSEKDRFIHREIQRRTLWSCCLLDRYLSWGKQRPRMLMTEDLQNIQLVCSDRAFNLGRKKVRTRLLGEDNAAYEKRREELRESAIRHHNERNPLDQARRLNTHVDDTHWEVGDLEGELGWYIQIVDHFGDIVKWSCAGGRRREGSTPPWDKSTTFYQLETKLQRLKAGLPEQLQLTPENTQDRIYNGSEKYVLIHAMYMMCTVWLYREYMAMMPWKLTEPQGPLDEPLIAEKPPHPSYWSDQAKACFGACRDFAELLHAIHSSRSNNKLVETPTVAFAAYTVAWCTIYCFYFPKMDPDGALTTRRLPRADDITRDFLTRMSVRFTMATDWSLELARVQRFLRDERKRYKIVGGEVGGSPQSATSDGGGGLKDYALHFETSHKSFGTILNKDASQRQDKDIDMADTRLPHEDGSEERAERASAPPLKVERGEVSTDMSAQSTPVHRGGFTPVNVYPNPGDEIRVRPNGPISANGPQTPIQASSVDSAFHPHDRPYASPTDTYQHNVGPYPQHSLSATRDTPTFSHDRSHVSANGLVQEDAGFPNWPPIGLPINEARLQMEQFGAQGLHNDEGFKKMIMREGFPVETVYDYPMDMSFSNNMNPDTNASYNIYGNWSQMTYGPNNFSYPPS
ncbi:hypothetical protein BKA66DRAFT_460930 [Pyrenochaeta sp. MPI-SDFR-AT-0127]|nr:hypothetical protein BKA66DRAFT_460930 [Pyrenochaeta sp. MPI-SDFR-AT-0127]